MKVTIQNPKTKNFYGPGDETDWMYVCKTTPHFFTLEEAKKAVEEFCVPPTDILEIRSEDGELVLVYPTYGKTWFTFII